MESNKKESHRLNIRPPSCISFSVNILGIFGFFASLFLMTTYFPNVDKVITSIVTMIFAALPIVIADLLVFKRYKSCIIKPRNAFSIKRAAVKIVGTYSTFAIILFCYWLIPEYGDWYERYFKMLLYVAPFIAISVLLYFLLIEKIAEQSEDGYWHLGRFILGILKPSIWRTTNKTIITEHFRSWLVKAFFLPLMFIFLSNNITFLVNYDYDLFGRSFILTYNYVFIFLYTIDVIFAAIGYVMTFKVLDSHIRSVEPTMLGWVVCLMCYPPFWNGLFSKLYFQYGNDYKWGDWLGNTGIHAIIWGSGILFLIFIYSSATVAMGYRFSNLTYRGLITSGPYRFSKHPAYIAKNLSFWMISIPFISSVEFSESIKMSLLLLCLNFIYFMRARTEEKHLSRYPEYIEYTKWINKNGIFRFFSHRNSDA